MDIKTRPLYICVCVCVMTLVNKNINILTCKTFKFIGLNVIIFKEIVAEKSGIKNISVNAKYKLKLKYFCWSGSGSTALGNVEFTPSLPLLVV